MAKTASKIEIEVQPRTESGKNSCRRIRATDMVPGNVYGLNRPPFMVSVPPRRIEELLALGTGVNTIFSLRLPGESRTRDAMIKEMQRDPLTEKAIHIDFVRVDPDQALQVNVPIQLEGTPVGVKNEGGILDFVQREVQVECLPGDIPEYLSADVTELHVNQNISVRDLTIGENVRLIGDPEQIVAVVVAPRVEEEPVAEAEAEVEGEEPEVIAKGKESEAEPPAESQEK